MPTSDFTYILLESTEAFANLYGMQDTGNSPVEFVNRGFKGVPPTHGLPPKLARYCLVAYKSRFFEGVTRYTER